MDLLFSQRFSRAFTHSVVLAWSDWKMLVALFARCAVSRPIYPSMAYLVFFHTSVLLLLV